MRLSHDVPVNVAFLPHIRAAVKAFPVREKHEGCKRDAHHNNLIKQSCWAQAEATKAGYKSSAERAAETPVPVNHRDRMITLCCQSKWSLTSGGNRLHPNFSANIHSFERSCCKVYFQLKKRKSIFFPLNVHGNLN